MKQWVVPVRIVEHGVEVTVEAETRAEARKKAQQAVWIECSDPDRHTVTVTGKAVEIEVLQGNNKPPAS
jgi:hypothetical protein